MTISDPRTQAIPPPTQRKCSRNKACANQLSLSKTFPSVDSMWPDTIVTYVSDMTKTAEVEAQERFYFEKIDTQR